jgi:CRP-like cAMP-binding protein
MTSNDLSSKFGPLPRVLTWAKRYGAAEVTGTLTAYLGYQNLSRCPTVATLGRSAVIGEYGIFTGSKRTATIIAKGSVTLLALDYERFHRFMLAFPEGTIALLENAILRQVETQKASQSQ